MLLDYKNTYWSRLMVLDNYETGEQRKWPLGKDIVEEIKYVAELPEVEPLDLVPLFDPLKFN